MTSRRWSNVTKLVVSATLVILAIIVVITFRAMIAPTIVALLLAFILGYPVNWLQRQTGWSRQTAVVVLYLLLVAALILTPALIIPRASGLATSLQRTLEELIESLQTTSTGFLLPFGNFQLSADDLLQQVGDGLQNLLLAAANPFSLFRGFTTGIVQFVYVVVLNFWLLTDLHKLRRWLYEQIPIEYQEDMRRLAEELGETWQAFLRGQIVLGLVIGIMTWIPLAIVGMENAGGLALLAGVMEFLPNVGQAISATIGTLVALFQGSTWLPVNQLTFAIIVTIIYLIIGQIENVYLVPRLVGGRVKLHPAVAFVGTVAGALVFGVLGVLLATPVIASARVILIYIYHKLMDREPFPPERTAQTSVRIPGLIAGRKVEALVFDLDGTLAELDWRAMRWAVSYFYWLERFLPADQRRRLARRLMVQLEGGVNFLLTQVRRYGLLTQPRVRPLLPLLDALRGYPLTEHITPLPGVVATLSHLAGRYPLALISTREHSAVQRFLLCVGLEPTLFTVIVTAESVRNLLPHSEGLGLIAEQLRLEPNQLLMVSDTDVNLRAARAMGMATAGVLSGLSMVAELQDADLILDSVVNLPEWL
jgi:predicted PurR-regulated permease PerM/phosphoglycolate phosphatase-like HAD superfamily hydrolase